MVPRGYGMMEIKPGSAACNVGALPYVQSLQLDNSCYFQNLEKHFMSLHFFGGWGIIPGDARARPDSREHF